jgi:hypothetical protein
MPSRQSAEQPEFFFDRSLGKTTAAGLRELGWILHLVGDHFPNDGQHTSDEEWITYGLSRGWPLLAKDKRIRYVTPERQAITNGVLFVLSNGNLRINDMVNWFNDARRPIYRHARETEPAIYVVYAGGKVEQRWPPKGLSR